MISSVFLLLLAGYRSPFRPAQLLEAMSTQYSNFANAHDRSTDRPGEWFGRGPNLRDARSAYREHENSIVLLICTYLLSARSASWFAQRFRNPETEWHFAWHSQLSSYHWNEWFIHSDSEWQANSSDRIWHRESVLELNSTYESKRLCILLRSK